MSSKYSTTHQNRPKAYTRTVTSSAPFLPPNLSHRSSLDSILSLTEPCRKSQSCRSQGLRWAGNGASSLHSKRPTTPFPSPRPSPDRAVSSTLLLLVCFLLLYSVASQRRNVVGLWAEDCMLTQKHRVGLLVFSSLVSELCLDKTRPWNDCLNNASTFDKR